MADTTPPAERGDPTSRGGVPGGGDAPGQEGAPGQHSEHAGPGTSGTSGTPDAPDGSGLADGTGATRDGRRQRDESDPRGRDDRDERRTDGMVRDLRRLHRSEEGRVVGGVCAGLGRDLQVDPVLLRVVLAVLAPFGGVGLLLYAAGWVLIPRVGEDRSILEQQLGRRRDGKPDGPVFVAGLVVIGLVVVSIPWWGLPWHVPALLVLSILGLVALLRRQSDRVQAPDAPAEAAPPGAAMPPSDTSQPSEAAAPGGGTAADAPTTPMTRPLSEVADSLAHTGHPAHTGGPEDTGAAAEPDSYITRPLATPHVPAPSPGQPAQAPDSQDTEHTRPLQVGSWRASPPAPPGFWDQPDPLGLGGNDTEAGPSDGPASSPDAEVAPVPPPPPPRRRRRFVLFAVTMLAAVVVCAALTGLQEGSRLPDGRYAVTVPAGGYVAAVLAVIGLGLIAGTWFGRSRGLIAVGTILAVALVPVTAADFGVTAAAHDHTVRPTSIEQVRPSYDYSTGRVRLDLTRLPLRDGQEVRTSVDQGTGELVVRVPPRVDVHVDAEVGVGDLKVFHRTRSGADNSLQATDLGTDGAGGGDLWLKVDLGVGTLKVNRG